MHAFWKCVFWFSEDGFKDVYFHVLRDLSTFNQEKRKEIQEIISAIVGCETNRIFFNGYRHSESFIAIVSVEVIYVKKLLAIDEQGRQKFEGLDIDYFTVDFFKVFLRLSKGKNSSYLRNMLFINILLCINVYDKNDT